jgi:hypothetical protein
MLGQKAFSGQNERKRKTGCRKEFRIYLKIGDTNQGDLIIFKPNLN